MINLGKTQTLNTSCRKALMYFLFINDQMELNNIISALCCAVFAIILYLNTLSAELAYDDNRAILRNPDLLPETPLINLFYNDFWGTPLTDSGSHKSYRPLCILTFRLNYAISGFNPFSYHLVNVLLHGFVTLLYVITMNKITKQHLVSTVAGLLFASHPVHSEAVAGIVGRAEILSCIFFLLALLCYVSYCKSTALLHRMPCSSYCRLSGVAVCSMMAMLCKEQGLTVLIVCIFYDLFLYKNFDVKSLFFIFYQPKKLYPLRGLLIICILGVFLITFRVMLMGFVSPEFAPADNPASESDNMMTRTLTFFFLPLLNFALLLCPITLSFDWSMDAIPLVESTDIRNIASLIFYSSLFFLLIFLSLHLNRPLQDSKICSASYSCDRDNKTLTFEDINSRNHLKPFIQTVVKFSAAYDSLRCICLGLVLIIIPFLPATNIFFYVGFVLAERILYIPSMGFCLLVAQGFCFLLSYLRVTFNLHRIWHLLIWAFFFMLILTNSVRTVVRNKVWSTEESLYRSGVQINPAKAWGNLGNILKAQGKLEEAELAYKSALAHRSNMADVHYNLGLYYQEKNQHMEAIHSYIKAIEYRPKLTVAYLNLGLVYFSLGLKAEAEKMLRQCYNVDVSGLKDPRLHVQTKISALYNLGRLLADENRLLEAVDVYKRSLENVPPDYPVYSIYNMMGEAYFKMENLEDAETLYRQALLLKSDHIPAHLTLAKLFQSKRETTIAEEWFLKALIIDPNDVSIYKHYGQFLVENERYTEGVNVHLKALELIPNDFELVFNAANAMRQAGRHTEAENLYKKAVDLKPTEVVALMNLGAMLHYNGKLKEAEVIYLNALEMKPDDLIIETNLLKLRKLMSQKNIVV